MKQELHITIQFDDFHPTTKPYDFGGIRGKVLERIFRLHNKYGLKLSMFASADWIDLPHDNWMRILRKTGKNLYNHNHPSMLWKHPEWCNIVGDFVQDEYMEICNHGYHHFNFKNGLHQQEFLNLSYEEAKEKIKRNEDDFKMHCGIDMVKIFRPPGYGFNKNTIKALIDLEYYAIAPFPSWYQIENGTMGKYGELEIVKGQDSIANKFEPIQQGGFCELHLKGHMQYQYGQEIIENGISNDYVYKNLTDQLDKLKKKYEFVPKFISEVL